MCIGKREAGTARVLTATRFVCAMQEEGRGRLRWAFDVSMIKVVDGSDDVRCGGLFTPALGAFTHLDDPLIVPLHQLGVARMCSSVGVHGRRYPWLLVRPRVVVLNNGCTYSRSPRCLYRRGFGARDCQTAFPVALTETSEGMCLLVAGHYKSRIQPPLQLLCLPRGVAAADH